MNEIERVAQHLGVVYSQQLLEDIARATGIASMRESKTAIAETYQANDWVKKVNVYRKGQYWSHQEGITAGGGEEGG